MPRALSGLLTLLPAVFAFAELLGNGSLLKLRGVLWVSILFVLHLLSLALRLSRVGALFGRTDCSTRQGRGYSQCVARTCVPTRFEDGFEHSPRLRTRRGDCSLIAGLCSLSPSYTSRSGYNTAVDVHTVLNGDVHTKHLRRIFYDHPLTAVNTQGGESQDSSRPLTEAEQRIRDVLSAATRVPSDSIQTTTTTLELGVDSLSAISLSLDFKAAGFYVPPHVILTGPTVEKLSKASQATMKGRDDAVNWEVEANVKQQAIAQSRYPVQSVLPCLPLQEGLAALTLNHPDPIYVNHFVTVLEKETDVDKLKNAILETICANGILRTCFHTASDRIVQVVLAPGVEALQWRIVDVDGDRDGLSVAHMDSMPAIERELVENIGHLPPARFTLNRDSAESRCLCWTLHHAIYDGECTDSPVCFLLKSR